MPNGNTRIVLEYRDEPASPDDTYLTYRKWQAMLIQQICVEYECEAVDAAMCVNTNRWWSYHIEPLMKAGVLPSPSVLKSLHKHCGYAVWQLQRMFWSWHGQEFVPVGYGLDGVKIPYSFRISSKRRRKVSQ